MIIDVIRILGDIAWELTCLMAGIGLCAAVTLIAICVVQAVWEILTGNR